MRKGATSSVVGHERGPGVGAGGLGGLGELGEGWGGGGRDQVCAGRDLAGAG